jgi:hypothetical protein
MVPRLISESGKDAHFHTHSQAMARFENQLLPLRKWVIRCIVITIKIQGTLWSPYSRHYSYRAPFECHSQWRVIITLRGYRIPWMLWSLAIRSMASAASEILANTIPLLVIRSATASFMMSVLIYLLSCQCSDDAIASLNAHTMVLYN